MKVEIHYFVSPWQQTVTMQVTKVMWPLLQKVLTDAAQAAGSEIEFKPMDKPI